VENSTLLSYLERSTLYQFSQSSPIPPMFQFHILVEIQSSN